MDSVVAKQMYHSSEEVVRPASPAVVQEGLKQQHHQWLVKCKQHISAVGTALFYIQAQ